MAESPNLASEAIQILITPNHERFPIIIGQLFMRQETEEYKSAKALYDLFVTNFENAIAQKLLNEYRCSSDGVHRFRSIYLLSETLANFRESNFQFSRVALCEIKPLVISCLKMKDTKESDVKILRRIVSFVAYNVAVSHNSKWDELSDCILWLAETEPLKAFHVFIDLPLVYGKFINGVIAKVLDKIEIVLVHSVQDRFADWCLALETIAKIGVQIQDQDMRSNFIQVIAQSAGELVEKELKEVLEKGIEDLKKLLARDMNLFKCKYSKDQVLFVGKIGFNIAACYNTIEECKEIAKEILQVAKNPENYNNGSLYDSDWYEHLKNLSSTEILRIFASNDLEDRSREIAIRRVSILVSDHDHIRKGLHSNHISVISQLQPLLISCLEEEGLSDSLFKILGEVVSHVMLENLIWQLEPWYGLRDYIVSKSKTEFQKAVYIFKCLTMQQDEDESFMIPVTENLLPEICSRLNPPRELLVDNSCWVLAFTGAFCAIIHLIEIPSKAEIIKEIAYKMIDSVKDLVEREMEVGLVRRAFRDVESIVKKQLEWYDTSEYKFCKALLWKLYAINGMRWESKIVLWRINFLVEREVDKDTKEFPENEFDWINPPEDKDFV